MQGGKKNKKVAGMLKNLYILLIFVIFTTVLNAQVNTQTGSSTFEVPIFNFQDNISNLSLPVVIGYNSGNGLKVDEVASDIGQGWGLMAGGKIVRVQVGEPDDQKPFGGEGVNEVIFNSKYPAGYLYTNQDPQNGPPEYYQNYPVFADKDQVYRQHNVMLADRESDRFIMNLNGVTITFVLDKSTFNAVAGTGTGYSLGLNHFKIAFSCATGTSQSLPASVGLPGARARTLINQFIITDDNGIEYVFNTMAYNKLQRLQPCNLSFDSKVSPPKKLKKGGVYCETYFDEPTIINPYIVNEWQLTEIKDRFISGRKISFNYTYRNLNTFTGFEYTFTDNLGGKHDYGKRIAKKAVYIVPVVSTITCPNHYGINFNYGAQRLDLMGLQSSGNTGSKCLENISVTYNGRVVQRHVLKQSYVIYTRYGTPITPEEKWASRLYLISVTKQTADLKDEERPYIFDYNLGGSNKAEFVPPPFFISKDIWGYYDGYQSILGEASLNINDIKSELKADCVVGTRLGVLHPYFTKLRVGFPGYGDIRDLAFRNEGELTKLRNNYASLGLLKSIQYPSGSYMEYQYTQNRAKFFGQAGGDNYVGGVHVSATTVYDGGYSNNCATNSGIKTTYNFINEDGSSSMWGMEKPINTYTASSAYKPFDRKLKLLKLLIWGKPKCKYGFQYPGISYTDEALSVSGFQKFMSSSSVEAVSDILGAYGTVMNILTIARAGFAQAGPFVIVSLIIDIIMTVFDAVYTCFVQDDVKETNLKIWYNKDLRSSNPLPLLYKRVEVAEGVGNGKTVSEFTSNDQFAVWEPNPQLFDMRQRYGMWMYGLPLKTVVYDAAGRKQKSVENVYSAACTPATAFNNIETPEQQTEGGATHGPSEYKYAGRASFPICNYGKIPLNLYNCNVQVKKAYPAKSTDWNNYPQNITYPAVQSPDLYVGHYNLFTGKVKLENTIEKDYEQNNDLKYTEKTTSYSYKDIYEGQTEDLLLPTMIEESAASGIVSRKQITYLWDNIPAASSPEATLAYTTLRNNGVKTIPVFTKVQVANVESGSIYYKYISTEKQEFIKTPAGNIEHWRTWLQRTNVPLTESELNSNVPVLVSEKFYNNEGVLAASAEEGGRVIAYLSDYDNQSTVASAINLRKVTVGGEETIETVAYTSFETGKNNGFSFNNGARMLSTSITGNNYYQLSGGNITATINSTSRPYLLTLWASSPISVSNSSLLKTGPVRKGFTLYEYALNPGSNSVTISGSAHVDEIRLFPKDVRIATTAYDPIIGKMAECDANNRFTTYEYDSRGRLKLIKDDKGDIVKMYEYQEKGNFEKCPAVYYSHAVYQPVQKDNCGSDYIGGYVDFLIPAGAYTSSISQLDADLKAQLQIDSDAQNFANDHGACHYLYKSEEKSVSFFSENCAPGYEPVVYTYTVPAGTYTSLTSVADANDQRDEDIADNGQVMADLHGGCISTTEPQWEADEPFQTQCGNASNGVTTGHRAVYMKDINPNSVTYNQWRWIDNGEDATCSGSPTGCSTYKITVPNTASNNLYISYLPCGATTYVSIPWSSLDVYPTASYDGTIAELCLTHQPNFRYGPNGNDVDVSTTITIENLGSCSTPPEPVCYNCTGDAYRCINNICTLGVKVYTHSEQIGYNYYKCTYHYTWYYNGVPIPSEDHYEYSNLACPQTLEE